MEVIKRSGSWYVSDGNGLYPCTARRLNEAAKSQDIAVFVVGHRTPRRALIKRKNGKVLQTDRHWKLSVGLLETAEILYTLQKLGNKGKRQFYKKLGL